MLCGDIRRHASHPQEIFVTETVPSAVPATVAVVQGYLADLEGGDREAAGARFAEDLVYLVPGRNQLAGETRGPDAAGRGFAAMGELSGGTYRLTNAVDWLASDSHAVLLAEEHGTVTGREHDWTRAIVFTVDEGLIHGVQLLEDDQYGYDAWLMGAPAASVGDNAWSDEPPPGGPPQMSGDLDDPRVRAVLSYQRQVGVGDLDSARAIFWPDVTYTVPGHSQLAGTYRGPDEVMGYFGKLSALTGGTYAISRMHWTTSPDRVGLLTRNHATRNGKSLAWDELIVFTFIDGRKKSIAHFSGDQYGVDELLA